MSKRFLIVLRRAPYGRLDAAEAVRHLAGSHTYGLEATALLMEDGVYLAKAGQAVGPSWTELSAALAQTIRVAEGEAGHRAGPAVYVHAAALRARGLAEADLVPGCQVADDATAAGLLAAANATLVY